MLLLLCLLGTLYLSLPLMSQPTTSPPPLGAAPVSAGVVLVLTTWCLPRHQASTTTGALLSLFREQRYVGILYAVPLIAGMSLTLRLSNTEQNGWQQVADKAISLPLGIAVVAGTAVFTPVSSTKATS